MSLIAQAAAAPGRRPSAAPATRWSLAVGARQTADSDRCWSVFTAASTSCYVGRVGTGYGQSKVSDLMQRLKAVASRDISIHRPNAPRRIGGSIGCGLNSSPRSSSQAGLATVWSVKPHSRGLREDKPAAEVEAEIPANRSAPR